MLARVRAVYAAAITAYLSLVEEWLLPLGPRLNTFVTLPARIVGWLETPADPTSFAGPVLRWYLDPLPAGQASAADFVVSVRPDTLGERDAMRERYLRLVTLRPAAQEWISTALHHQALHIFDATPVIDIAFQWLGVDLRGIYL